MFSQKLQIKVIFLLNLDETCVLQQINGRIQDNSDIIAYFIYLIYKDKKEILKQKFDILIYNYFLNRKNSYFNYLGSFLYIVKDYDFINVLDIMDEVYKDDKTMLHKLDICFLLALEEDYYKLIKEKGKHSGFMLMQELINEEDNYNFYKLEEGIFGYSVAIRNPEIEV